MFIQLRKKLALAYALLAGLVLSAVALSCLTVFEAGLRREAPVTFDNGVKALVYKLQSDHIMPASYLAQSEAGSRQVIHIMDGDMPLFFRGGWTPKTDRARLIAMAQDQAAALGLKLPKGSLAPQQVDFSMTGHEGEPYLASVVLVPIPGAQPVKMTVIKDMSTLDEQIHAQRLTVLALGVGGLVALAAIGWIYSGYAVKPAQQNHMRQVEFTQVASHELKAPLAVISASAQAMRDQFSPTLLSNIEGECARMARLVDDMLLLSRSDGGGWAPGNRPVDLDTLLIECYEMFQPLYRAKGLSLTLQLPGAPLHYAMGDELRIKQVLAVFLENALGYAAQGVVLSAQVLPRCVRMSVADDGPGVADDMKKKVFDRFFRADAAHADRTHYGLGLSVARELARLHGGKVWVEDNAPTGAVFAFTLPVAKQQTVARRQSM